MMTTNPNLLHSLLKNLSLSIAKYACYQIENGAQLIQLFDSWAGHLSPRDYDEFAAPYQKVIIEEIKLKHPEVPTIMYIKHCGGLLSRMAKTGVDVVSLDWTVDIGEARIILDAARKEIGLPGRTGVQGNLDPMLLFSDDAVIKERALEIIKKAGERGHVMNLGHGIEMDTPEEKAKFFIDTVKGYTY